MIFEMVKDAKPEIAIKESCEVDAEKIYITKNNNDQWCKINYHDGRFHWTPLFRSHCGPGNELNFYGIGTEDLINKTISKTRKVYEVSNVVELGQILCGIKKL